MTGEADRRHFSRAPVAVIVRVECDGQGRHYYSKNISPGGVFLLAEQPLEVETRVRVELFLPLVKSPVRAEGEVAWVQRQEPSGFAIRFTEISEAARDLIRWVVERYLGKKD
jgi:uncharacterized protein (TIGR02266 family)